MTDTPEQANVRKGFKELLESEHNPNPNAILSYALGAASACWNDLGNAGEFRTDLIEVIMEETSKRLGFTSDHNKTAVEKFSIYGDGLEAWIVYDVGYHTCGGYGPESGYMHEPGCGYEPVVQMKNIQGLQEWMSNYE